ncbi:MAG: 4Fe-4S binding protein [Acidobacteria bacterium]|nr:4Fe-4S binding protein [Acidobacteriota bacterium]
MTATAVPTVKTRKLLVRRFVSKGTRRLRSAVQAGFLLLNVWIAVQFILFVRQFETPGSSHTISRPPGVDGWLPIAGLMNLKAFVLTGQIPAVHPATLFLITAFLSMSLVLRKAFCSWLCPVGTVSEWLWKAGRSIFGRNFALPRWLDVGLRSLKYILMGLFVYVVAAMSVDGIRAFLDSPYGLIADVKMLNLFRLMTTTTAIVLGVLAVASIFVQNFWCRYLCPYGALMGLAALASPLRIRRNAQACIDCGKCAKACPSRLPVDVLVQIRSAECLGCMECVNVCPAEGALDMKALSRRRVEPWMVAAGVAVIFLGLVGYAQATGHWRSAVPNAMYERLIPNADEFTHPR